MEDRARYCPCCDMMTVSQLQARPDSPTPSAEACERCWEKYPEFREGPYSWNVAEARHQAMIERNRNV